MSYRHPSGRINHNRFGHIQTRIYRYLEDCGGRAFIAPTLRICSVSANSEFNGLDWEQIEAALERLIKRSIIVRDTPRGYYRIYY
jgi:uncharacterized protein (DUF433 family)